MGSVKLVLVTRSAPGSASSKSKNHATAAIVCTAMDSAIFLPKHVRGPPWKTGNSDALRDTRR